jgi:multiple sugar transport system substrate-binding protein
MKLRKMVAMVLTGMMLILALSGCSADNAETSADKPKDSSSTDTKTETETKTETDSETPASTKEPVTVVVWNQIFEEWNQEFFTQKAEEYNALGRGYVVEQSFIAGDAWTERMTAAQAGGTAPDTYVLSYNGIVSAARDSMILPLDDLLPAEAFNDLNDNVKEMVSYDGKYWAYPQLVEPSTVLYYRTDLFEEAGITKVPTTWDELIEAAKKLTTNDMFGLSIPDFPSMGWCTWGLQHATSGHLAINDNWDAPLIDQGYIDLANFYKECYDTGVVPEQSLAGYATMQDFGEGNVAMKFCGSWGVAQIINDYPELADKFAVAAPPTKDGNQDTVLATNGGWTYVIDAKTDAAEGAADYISWLLAEDIETSAEFFQLASYAKAAPRKSVTEYLNANAGDSTWAETVNYVSAHAISEPIYPWDISVAVALMFENTALGMMSAEDAAAETTASIQAIIDNQGLAGKNPRK